MKSNRYFLLGWKASLNTLSEKASSKLLTNRPDLKKVQETQPFFLKDSEKVTGVSERLSQYQWPIEYSFDTKISKMKTLPCFRFRSFSRSEKLPSQIVNGTAQIEPNTLKFCQGVQRMQEHLQCDFYIRLSNATCAIRNTGCL